MNRPSITREAIVEAAREALGTPFHHEGRLVGVGIDCVGLLVHVARRLNVSHVDVPHYPRLAVDASLEEILALSLERIDPAEARHGDVLCFWLRKPTLPQHVAFRTPVGMLHTYAKVGRVVEHEFSANWPKHVSTAWRYPGVA